MASAGRKVGVHNQEDGSFPILAKPAALSSEDQLRQSEEKFAKAFRSSPMAMTISTRAEGRYVDVNDAFLRMMGLRREEVLYRTSFDLDLWKVPEDRSRLVKELDRAGRVDAFEIMINSVSKGPRLVQVSAELIQLDGLPCVLAITNDVTEAKALEERFLQAQKMDAMGRLAGGIAHDFNNMLGVVIGYCDMAQRQADLEGVIREVARIRKAAELAANLTRQLLAFSRQQVCRPRILDLNIVVRDVLQMLGRVLGTDVKLKFVPSSSLGNVKADPGQIEQVLINLLVNARDAMPRGGAVTIRTFDVNLDAGYVKHHAKVDAGPYVLLAVTDTGYGMSDDMMSRIFEPFFTTKPRGEGTGLGLSMVYGAMQQAGGHIGVSSEEGKGTTFHLYFPRIGEQT